MGFEPTCPFTDNRISSAARYDHFDTAPCINFVLVSRFLERHSGENRFSPLLRRTPEALILLHFLTVSFLLKPVISSVVRLWQIHDWSRPFRVTLLRAQKPRRRKGLRTFRLVSAGGDSNRPKVQIKPRSCVNSPRSCAFARSQARKQRPQQRR